MKSGEGPVAQGNGDRLAHRDGPDMACLLRLGDKLLRGTGGKQGKDDGCAAGQQVLRFTGQRQKRLIVDRHDRHLRSPARKAFCNVAAPVLARKMNQRHLGQPRRQRGDQRIRILRDRADLPAILTRGLCRGVAYAIGRASLPRRPVQDAIPRGKDRTFHRIRIDGHPEAPDFEKRRQTDFAGPTLRKREAFEEIFRLFPRTGQQQCGPVGRELGIV